ncbi:ImmA/IrrE family metallo-endopeptidase [Selenomonas sp.]|uniref:ImmA/IrrE family metallo-endopeptidase n=1 Tax=Selenomonas sp. TaxID=2053611 RepID=UPI0025FE99DC|nr:ImmA/IrrE family metallo-endopeptidase [Selenomonas sp.]MCI6284004.1 ImmA/IrrE family metallo-endopeptidase [Selenomonas sp.]
MSTYRMYSRKQLQEIAENFLRFHRPNMLEIPEKDFDVYSIVEDCLHVDVDWQYLSPDESILGMTAFESGQLAVYVDEGVFPHEESKFIHVEKGTILIERALTEDETRKGQENFTVMHEVFHAVLHQKFFLSLPESARMEHQKAKPRYRADGHRKFEDPLDFVEWQADTCAACFLMPEKAMRNAYDGMERLLRSTRTQEQFEEDTVELMAMMFHVSRQAMKIRLSDLGLMQISGK